MKSRFFLIPLPVVIGLLASCYPLPDNPQPQKPATNQGEQTLTSEEQQKIEEQRDRMREEAERREQQRQQTTERSETPPPTSEPTRTTDYPFATPVPGKAGFVFSPYNNKVVDVRDIPSGTLVQDPTYPPADKKYFRVP